MNSSMNKYFRMGTVHFMSYPDVLGDETKIVPTLKKLMSDPYFSVIEMAPITSDEIRAEVKELFAHSDVDLIYTAAPKGLGDKLNPNSEDKARARADVETLKKYIDEAIDMGAKGIGIIGGKYNPEKFEEAFSDFVDVCKELCDYAKKKPGFMVEVEQFDFDFHNKLIIGSSETTKRLAQEMESYDNFGIIVDLSHIPLVHETPRQCVETIGKFITHIHIGNAVCDDKDSYLFGDFHPRFSLEHSAVGLDELEEYINALFDIGYLGDTENRPIMTFEIKAWPGDDPEIVLAECKRMMGLAWANISERY